MKVKRRIYLYFHLLLVLSPVAVWGAGTQPETVGLNKVVIDAGHGGKDPGATAGKIHEKDITLAVALKLGKLINEYHPDVEVIYTRKTDVFVDLYKRGDIANKAGADLFISIHVNAAKNKAASGTETLVMGMSHAERNLEVARLENDVILLEDDYSANYQGYVPGDPESFIIFSLMQYIHQDQSVSFANMVQNQFSKNSKMSNRGVKQAPVLVLWKTAMPSVLAEFGFISNSADCGLISSEKGKNTYAQCLFNAFSEYKAAVEGRGTKIVVNDVKPGEGNIQTSTGGSNREKPKEKTVNTARKSGKNIVYKVQLASSDKKLPKNSSVFGTYRGQVEERIINNAYKYYHGNCTFYEEALSLQSAVRKEVKDAFVVAFEDGKPIPVAEARKLK